MSGAELVELVKSDQRFLIAGALLSDESPSEDEIVIENVGSKSRFAFKFNQLGDITSKDVFEVLCSERAPNIMTWVARIVGYYSQIKNESGWGWNRSKLAELADRHKGNYTVPGTQRSAA